MVTHVSASKNGEAVDLSDGDVVFSFYDATNVQELGNRYITVADNELTVTPDVLSQNICVRVSDSDGIVSASLPVRIKAADKTEIDEEGNKEKIIFVDACEDVNNSQIKSGAADGSHYYECATTTVGASFDATTEDTVIEFDIKCLDEGAGVSISSNGKVGGQLTYATKFSNGTKALSRESGGSVYDKTFTPIANVTEDNWYHVVYSVRCGSATVDSETKEPTADYLSNYANVKIYGYDADGNLVNPNTGEKGTGVEGSLQLRTMGSSNIKLCQLNVNANTCIDNIRVLRAISDEIRVTTTSNAIFAGMKMQASYTVYRQGVQNTAFPAKYISWSLCSDENGTPLADDTISIDEKGLVTTTKDTEVQTFYIKVTSNDSGVSALTPVTIKSSDTFSVVGFGTNEDKTSITELNVRKDFFYNGDVVFIVAVYDTDGVLMDVRTRSMKNNTLAIGENKIAIDEIALTENFGEVKAMVWTSF